MNHHDRARQLAHVARVWLDEDRVALCLDDLCAASELSPEMIRWGLHEALSRWTPEAFQHLLSRELTPPPADTLTLPPHTLGLVLAGTVPPAGLLAITLSLLLGAHTRVRPSQRVAPLITHFAHTLHELAPDLATHCEVQHFGHDETSMREFTRDLDALVVHGGDATLEHWRALTPHHTLFVGRGHRVSAAYLDADTARDPDTRAEALRGFALDLCAWDQTGCLSPLVLYIEAPTDPLTLGRELLHTAQQLAEQLPAGSWSLASRASRTTYLRSRLLDAEHLRGEDLDVLVYDHPHPPTPHCQHRVLELCPIPNDDTLIPLLASTNTPLQGLAVASPERRERFARALAHRGLNRVCAPGQLQRPPLTWSHDGQGEIRPLIRWIDLV